MGNPLLQKIISTSKNTSLMADAKKMFGAIDIVTEVPMMNIALSASINHGLSAGLHSIAGPSKHFKTAFMMYLAGQFHKRYPDGILLFYDSEFGSPQSYFDAFGIDPERVAYCPIMDIEQFKVDIMKQLNALTKSDRVMIVVDSIGNLASRKEIEDALDDKQVTDMTRAKTLKSLYRMITPHLTVKGIPCIMINHTYQTLELYSKQVMGGGTGGVYSSQSIWFIGRQQVKEGTNKDLLGYNFIINIEKSRLVREQSKIPITVTFGGGIYKWSGMFELSQEFGLIEQSGKGWYIVTDPETGEVYENKRQKNDIKGDDEYWEKVIKNPDFVKFVENKYSITGNYDNGKDDHIQSLDE